MLFYDRGWDTFLRNQDDVFYHTVFTDILNVHELVGMIRMVHTADDHGFDIAEERHCAAHGNMTGMLAGIPPAKTVFEDSSAACIKSDGKLIAVTIIEPVHRMLYAEAHALVVVRISASVDIEQRVDISEHVAAAADVHADEHIRNADIGQRIVETFDQNADAFKAAVADKSNNYVAGVEYAVNVATPGALLDAQAKALTANGCPPSSGIDVVAATVIEDLILDIGNKELYAQDFEGYSDDDVLPFAKAYVTDVNTTYTKYLDANNGNKEMAASKYHHITTVGGNKVLELNNDQALRAVFLQLISPEDMLAKNGNDMYTDFHLSYKIKYIHYNKSMANVTDAFVGVVYNHDGATSYDMFALTMGGYGVNLSRHGGMYTTVDAGSDYYAGAKDSEGQVSIINRITKGKVQSAYLASGTPNNDTHRFASLYDWVNVDVYFSWENGSTVYVNGAKVSQANNTDNNEWALAHQNFGLGVYVAPTANAYIDDIKMVSCEADDLDMILDLNADSNATFGTTVPATGDATIYVVVAMAVAFVALAAVVIIRRNKATN